MAVKNKKVAAGVGIAAAAAAVLALGAGTYAGFVDTEEGPSSTLSTGTVFFDTPANADFEVKLAPGDTKTQTLSYTNGGDQRGGYTLDFLLDATSEGVEPCAGGADGPEIAMDATCGDAGDQGELDEQTSVVVTATAAGEAPKTESYADIAELVAEGFTYSAASGVTATFKIDFTFADDDDINNAAQGDSFVLTSTATLERPF